jgi:hypothetical protein
MAFPIIIPLAIVGLAAAAIYSASQSKPECPEIDTRTITPDEIQRATPKIQNWGLKWSRLPNGNAQMAVNEFMSIVFPQCRWNADVKTVFIRPDGSRFEWQTLVGMLKGKTVSEVADMADQLMPVPGRVGSTGTPPLLSLLFGDSSSLVPPLPEAAGGSKPGTGAAPSKYLYRDVYIKLLATRGAVSWTAYADSELRTRLATARRLRSSSANALADAERWVDDFLG